MYQYLVENWSARKGFRHGHCLGGADLGYDLFDDLLIFPWRVARVKMVVDHLGETIALYLWSMVSLVCCDGSGNFCVSAWNSSYTREYAWKREIPLTYSHAYSFTQESMLVDQVVYLKITKTKNTLYLSLFYKKWFFVFLFIKSSS